MSVGTVIRGAVRTVSGARGVWGVSPHVCACIVGSIEPLLESLHNIATLYHPKGLILTVITANINQNVRKNEIGPKGQK